MGPWSGRSETLAAASLMLIVHQNIKSAESLSRFGEQAIDLRILREINLRLICCGSGAGDPKPSQQ